MVIFKVIPATLFIFVSFLQVPSEKLVISTDETKSETSVSVQELDKHSETNKSTPSTTLPLYAPIGLLVLTVILFIYSSKNDVRLWHVIAIAAMALIIVGTLVWDVKTHGQVPAGFWPSISASLIISVFGQITSARYKKMVKQKHETNQNNSKNA